MIPLPVPAWVRALQAPWVAWVPLVRPAALPVEQRLAVRLLAALLVALRQVDLPAAQHPAVRLRVVLPVRPLRVHA